MHKKPTISSRSNLWQNSSATKGLSSLTQNSAKITKGYNNKGQSQTTKNRDLVFNLTNYTSQVSTIQFTIFLYCITFSSAPVTPPTPQCLAPSKQLSTAAQRQMALNELVTTEGSYHHEIAVFCSKVLPDFKQVCTK